jgi:ESCRT-I complex subunit TSG101
MTSERQVGDLLTKCQYKYKDLTRRDVMAALSYFKELSPRADKYVYPNGASKELVSLFGTIPVNFRNSTYNIPVQVYLPDAYPYEAPFVYVRPTPDMSINVSSAVDSNGRVYLPALSEWRHPMSDLYMLLNLLTIKFSEQTPLYSKFKSGGGGSAAAATTASTYSDPPYPTQNPPPYPISGVGMPMPSTATAYSNSPPLIATNPYYPMNNQPPQPLSHLKSNSNSNIGMSLFSNTLFARNAKISRFL